MKRDMAVIVVSLAVLLLATLPAAGQAGVAKSIRYGEVVSVTPTVVENAPGGTGARVGSTAGAVAGYALADRGDRWLGGLLGGVVGGAIGHAAERGANRKRGFELIIKLENGEEIAIDIPGRKQQFKPGDRVRLTTGGGRTRVTPA